MEYLRKVEKNISKYKIFFSLFLNDVINSLEEVVVDPNIKYIGIKYDDKICQINTEDIKLFLQDNLIDYFISVKYEGLKRFYVPFITYLNKDKVITKQINDKVYTNYLSAKIIALIKAIQIFEELS